MTLGLLGIEGFETDQTGSMWEVLHDDDQIVAAARSGGKGLRLDGFFDEAESWLWTPIDHVIVGFAFRHNGGTSSDGAVICAMQHPGAGRHGYLQLNEQNALEIYVYGQARKAVGNRILESGSWHYLEFRYKVSATVGEIEVRMNGNPVPELYWAGNTVASGLTPFINQFHFGEDVNRSFDYDDVYVRDNTTGLGYLGDVEVIGYGLQADFQNDWSRNDGATNFERLIEQTPDEDTTHVYTPDAGSELYEVGDTGYQGQILAVQLVARARKTTTYIWRFRKKVYLNGVLSYSPYYYLSVPTYETFPPAVFGLDPNGQAWTIATWNAMKVGFEAEPQP